MRISDWSSDVCASDLPLDTARCHRLLVTGAAGGLGTVLRHRLRPYADILRLSDISPMPPANQGEEVISCDLSDPQAVMDLVRGSDAIVHLGGVSVERPFEEILPANIPGTYNIYEAARVDRQSVV